MRLHFESRSSKIIFLKLLEAEEFLHPIVGSHFQLEGNAPARFQNVYYRHRWALVANEREYLADGIRSNRNLRKAWAAQQAADRAVRAGLLQRLARDSVKCFCQLRPSSVGITTSAAQIFIQTHPDCGSDNYTLGRDIEDDSKMIATSTTISVFIN